jgi:zinc transport system ATP-binding protein
MSLVRVKNLMLGYNGQAILKNLSFIVEEGDFICVVGRNGSGKTTLVKGILGLIKPMQGEVVFEDLQPNFVGYMPQETNINEYFPATVFEIVLSGSLNRAKRKFFYSQSDKKEALEKLELLKLIKIKNKSFNELSGGQKQKVLLARSLMATNKLLILDEPSNNLDFETKKDFYEILKKINQEQKITIIMITHDLDHDNLIGNKILSLREEIFYGKAEDFVRKIHHE